MEFGTHCSYSYCNQKDFLPFNCQQCSKSFCLEHRTQTSHECEFQKVQKKALVCPICTKTIIFQSALTEDEMFSIHTATECTGPSEKAVLQAQVNIKKTCLEPKCYQQLLEINTHNCKTCSKDFCLKHRFPEVHNCQNKFSKQNPLQQANKNPSQPQTQPQPIQNMPGCYNFNNPYNQQYLQNPWK